MLMEFVMQLVVAKSSGDRGDVEFAYKALEKLGVDRRTADVMAAEFCKKEAVE